MSRDDLHFRLRIPEDLKLRIEAAAKVNQRSMTAEMIAALERIYPVPDLLSAAVRELWDLNVLAATAPDASVAAHLRDQVRETALRIAALTARKGA